LDANESDVKTINKYKSALCDKPLDSVTIDPTLAHFKGAYKEQLKRVISRKINTEDTPQKVNAGLVLHSASDMNIFMTALTAFIYQIQVMMNKIRALNKTTVFAKSKKTGSSRKSATELSSKQKN
jgi:flagellar biosynthesis chaperone FliJ